MKNLAADIPISPKEGFTGFGPLGTPNGNGIGTFAKFISSTLGLMTIIAIIWFVFVFFTGAIGWIGAGNDKGKVQAAQQRIVNGVIGLAVTIAAIFIINLVGSLIGLPNILNISVLFRQIQI